MKAKKSKGKGSEQYQIVETFLKIDSIVRIVSER